VPEDRFGDLGSGAPDGPPPEEPEKKKSAAERFEELDERSPEPESTKRPDPPRPSGKYTWVVGIAAIIFIVIGGIRVAGNGSGEGLKGPDQGSQLPEFAAPLVSGGVTGDSNVKPRSSKDKTNPKPACEVRDVGTLNICDKWNRPVVLSFLFLRGAKCEGEFDKMERMRREFPDVNFVGVFFEPDRKEAEKVYDKHTWRFPVVVDRDGAVANLYSVGGCPMTVFANTGGKVNESHPGELTEAQLRKSIQALD
jgi:hypothetical protein